MKFKTLLLLAIAVSCGLVAMLGVQQVLSSNKGKAKQEKSQVLFALTEISPGTKVTEETVEFRDWPKDAIPEGAITKAEDYKDRALKVRAYPGEMLMIIKMGEPGDLGASIDIPAGMRVVSVPVDPTMTSSNMILPGDRVDVMVTYDTTIPNRGRVTRIETVLERVEVFATDNIRDLGADTADMKVKNFSLLVKPQEASIVKLADTMGGTTYVATSERRLERWQRLIDFRSEQSQLCTCRTRAGSGRATS